MENTFTNEYFELPGIGDTIDQQNIQERVQPESPSGLGQADPFDGYVGLSRPSPNVASRPPLDSHMMRAPSVSSLFSHPPPTSGYGTGGSVCILPGGGEGGDECAGDADPDPRMYCDFSPHQPSTQSTTKAVETPPTSGKNDSPWPSAQQQRATQMRPGTCSLASQFKSVTFTDESLVSFATEGDVETPSQSDGGYCKVC